MTNNVNIDLVNEICRLSTVHNITRAEAMAYYCDTNDLEPSEIVQELDQDFIELLKDDCRKSDVRVRKHFKRDVGGLEGFLVD